jgi:hypothetical protein
VVQKCGLFVQWGPSCGTVALSSAVQLCTEQSSLLMHTSSLSGIAWVTELLTGHPERIKCELGVRRHVFDVLVNLLRQAGLKDSKYILLEEQLAIFLYASVTSLSTCHIGECFQRSNDTISKYVCYCHFLNTAQSILNTSFKVFQMNSCRLFLPTNIHSLCPTT